MWIINAAVYVRMIFMQVYKLQTNTPPELTSSKIPYFW